MMLPEDLLKKESFQPDIFVEDPKSTTTNSDEKEQIENEDSLEESSKEIKRPRISRTYPSGAFSDSLDLGLAIYQHAGNKIRRLTLLEKMGRSPTSGTTRQIITTSNRYGITKGSYSAEYLELSPEAQIIFDNSKSNRSIIQSKFTLSIDQISPFKKLYTEYSGKRLPVQEVMRDFLKESGEQIDDFKECIDIFIVNVKDLGLLRTIGGAETLISIEQALEELPSQYVDHNSQPVTVQRDDPESVFAETPKKHLSDWDGICFYITPIGDEDSEYRRHSDLFLSSLVEPAVSELNLKVIRADKIGQQGLITTQIMEYVTRSRLVIIDLSFLNPNVFYEMALRHASKLPVVHIIRKADIVPFDVSQSRCIIIDNTDIYSFVPKIQTYQAEIATQARKALEDPEHRSNPITVFYPDFWNKI